MQPDRLPRRFAPRNDTTPSPSIDPRLHEDDTPSLPAQNAISINTITISIPVIPAKAGIQVARGAGRISIRPYVDGVQPSPRFFRLMKRLNYYI